MKNFKLGLLVFLMWALVGCTKNQQFAGEQGEASDKIKVIATLFPQYDFVRQIAGDRVELLLLLPPGSESHSFEPTPQDIIRINDSDLFIYTGRYMETWSERILGSLTSDTLTVLDVSEGIELIKDEDGHGHEAQDGHDHEYDPHIWTDPMMAKEMAANIEAALCNLDPDNAVVYKVNGDRYRGELDALDAEISKIVEEGVRAEIFFGGRFALLYFTQRYGLHYESAYANCSTEMEPSIGDIVRIIDEMKENQIPVLYYEELSEPKVARSISEETGADLLLFHSGHNVSKSDFENGITYLSLMKQNAENLRKGLQ